MWVGYCRQAARTLHRAAAVVRSTRAMSWAHHRRDFIHCAAGQVRLTRWCQGWIERIASIYRLNQARLSHYAPRLRRQTQAFTQAQGALEVEVERLFAKPSRNSPPCRPGRVRPGRCARCSTIAAT